MNDTTPGGAPAAIAGDPAQTPMQLDLRDIHAPGLPGIWPPAPGWWVAAALLLTAVTAAAHTGWRLYRLGRRRQRILAELDGLRATGDGPAQIAGVSALLKRAALARFPRQDVAALTGDAWLGFLDRTGGEGRFHTPAGRLLADAPYATPREVSGDEREALFGLARDWLRRNL